MLFSFSLTTATALLASFVVPVLSSPTSKERVAFSDGETTQWRQQLPLEPQQHAVTDSDDPHRSLTQHKNYTYNDFWINEGCATECPWGEFCGKDQGCHTFNCENVYAYGNPEGTFIGDESEDLTCVVYAPGEPHREFLSVRSISFDNGFPNAVYFSCPWGDDETCTVIPMNRQCFARQDEQHYYECYDIAPSTDLDLYFADYTEATASLENVTNNETGTVPRHFYHLDSYYEAQYLGYLVSGSVYQGATSSVEFNQTLASKAIHVIIADIPETPFPDCRDEGCLENEFCGSDLKCHTWDCENFYNNGPMEYTGHKQGDSPGLLECEVGAPATDCEWPTVVEYICQPELTYTYADYCSASDYLGEERFLGRAYMSRRCEAIPNKDQSFVCFDMNPSGTDFDNYFVEYLEIAANATCPNATNANGTSSTAMIPWHTYQFFVRFVRGSHTHTDSTMGGTFYREFDADRTRYAIQATLLGEPSSSSASTVSMMMWPCTFVGIVVATMAFNSH